MGLTIIKFFHPCNYLNGYCGVGRIVVCYGYYSKKIDGTNWSVLVSNKLCLFELVCCIKDIHYLVFELCLCLSIRLCFSVFLKEPCLFELICLA